MPREELQAALDARSELGRDLEPHLIDTFLDRVERSIDARVDARIEARLRAHGALGARERASPGPSGTTVLLALGSMAFGVGATGAATAFGDVMGSWPRLQCGRRSRSSTWRTRCDGRSSARRARGRREMPDMRA